MSFVGVGGRVHGEASDAAGPVAASAAAAAGGAGRAAHRRLLPQGVVIPDGEVLVVASGVAVNGGGALHFCGCAVVVVNKYGAAALAGVPLFGKAAGGGGVVVVWFEELIALVRVGWVMRDGSSVELGLGLLVRQGGLWLLVLSRVLVGVGAVVVMM